MDYTYPRHSRATSRLCSAVGEAYFKTAKLAPIQKKWIFKVFLISSLVSVGLITVYHRNVARKRFAMVPVLGRNFSAAFKQDLQQTTRLPSSPAHERSHQPLCESPPRGLKGRVHVDNIAKRSRTLMDVLRQIGEPLDELGAWKPSNCLARDKVTIIVPYRDRAHELAVLLLYLHPMLRRQLLDYSIVVVEQYGNATFNKAMLMNIGFLESQRLRPAKCVIFHDVDQIPENDNNSYACRKRPTHLCASNSRHHYRLKYGHLVGGALNFLIDDFKKVNGYSNMYWGWGGEDDDMASRIKKSGLKLGRPPKDVATYTSLIHKRSRKNRNRHKLLRTGRRRIQEDGLNSLTYNVTKLDFHPLFVYMVVDVGPPPL